MEDKEFKEKFLSENYTTIVVELPESIYKPEIWDKAYKDVTSLSSLTGKSIKIDSTYVNKSISDVAESFGGYVYSNVPNYSHSKILIHENNYTSIVEELKSLGFSVRDNEFFKASLNESRTAIGIPYTYPNPSGFDFSELTGNGRTIAIIDSGIDTTHPDLRNVIFWNDTTFERKDCCTDEYGHGTHVVSIAAGSGAASSDKYKGVAPNAKLKIWKVFVGVRVDSDWVAEAIRQAVKEGADVISLSLAYPFLGFPTADDCSGTTTKTDIKAVYDNIIDALNHNITVVASAGNSGPQFGTVKFPACMDAVIAVGATLKKNSPYYDVNIGSFTPNIDTARVNVSVNVLYQNLSWNGSWESWKGDWSGRYQIFIPTSWPATIKFEMQGEHKHRECYSSESKWLDNFGDMEFIYSGAIGVNIFVNPFHNSGICPFDFIGWYDTYFIPYNGETIYVNMFPTFSNSVEGFVTYYSSRGPPPQNPNLIKPEITAPGELICAANSSQISDYIGLYGEAICDNNAYRAWSGASQAVAHVAGLVALLKEANPEATVNDIRNALIHADEKILNGNPDMTEGYGRVSISKAAAAVGECYANSPKLTLNPSSISGHDLVEAQIYSERCYFINAEVRENSCSGPIKCSCMLVNSNCVCHFFAPYNNGIYVYYACIKDVNNSRTLSASNTLRVTTPYYGKGGCGGGRNFCR